MTDHEKRHLIEALRSGVPSKSVGKYFSTSRSELMMTVRARMENAACGESGSMVLSGKYGEGKTHMLNSLAAMASENNMAVSMIQLGKETPMNRPECIFSKLIRNTVLPPGVGQDVMSLFSSLSSGSDRAADMYLFASRRLKTDRLYFVLRALLEGAGSEDDDIDVLEADLTGSFASQAVIKKIYQKYAHEKAQISGRFSAKENTSDYVSFYSHLFRVMGCSGWVILFDEAELMGRFSRKTRESSYLVMKDYLFPPVTMENTFSVFAFSTSFMDEIIAGKNEYSAVALGSRTDEEKEDIRAVLDAITRAEELRPLTEAELTESVKTITKIYQDAYGHMDGCDPEMITSLAMKSGFLLRTRIRTAIEVLDQIYQYGDPGNVGTKDLAKEDLSEIDE